MADGLQPGLRDGKLGGGQLLGGVTPLLPVIQSGHAAHVARSVLPHGDGVDLGTLALRQGHVHVLSRGVVLEPLQN